MDPMQYAMLQQLGTGAVGHGVPPPQLAPPPPPTNPFPTVQGAPWGPQAPGMATGGMPQFGQTGGMGGLQLAKLMQQLYGTTPSSATDPMATGAEQSGGGV